MTPPRHRLAAEDFAALATGGGGARVMRTLVAVRRSRTLQLIRLVVGVTGADDVAVRRAYRALAEVRGTAPAAVDRVLDHPSVGAWATRTGLRLTRDEPADTSSLTGIAAAAAVRGRVPVTLRLSADGDLTLPSLGVVQGVPAGELAVLPDADGTEVGGVARIPADWSTDGSGWWPTPRLAVRGDGLLAEFQLERWETYQPTSGVAVAQAPDPATWQAMLTESWQLLVRHHREVAEELAAGVSVLTPLRASGTGSSSATVEDAFGCILLSLGPDAEAMAESLAHELRHNKLIALLDLFPLLESVPGERFYAPWRDDPRPLLGLLHGTYAYVGVTAFWRRQRFHEPTPAAETHAHTEFARWRRSALAATRTLLDSGRLTTAGRTFVTTMAKTLEEWCAEPVPAPAEAAAATLAGNHHRKWQSTQHLG
jgi:HEXXH motif-containing protein